MFLQHKNIVQKTKKKRMNEAREREWMSERKRKEEEEKLSEFIACYTEEEINFLLSHLNTPWRSEKKKNVNLLMKFRQILIAKLLIDWLIDFWLMSLWQKFVGKLTNIFENLIIKEKNLIYRRFYDTFVFN